MTYATVIISCGTLDSRLLPLRATTELLSEHMAVKEVAGYKEYKEGFRSGKKKHICQVVRLFMAVVRDHCPSGGLHAYEAHGASADSYGMHMLATSTTLNTFLNWIDGAECTYSPVTKHKKLEYLSSALKWLYRMHTLRRKPNVVNTRLGARQIECARDMVPRFCAKLYSVYVIFTS